MRHEGRRHTKPCKHTFKIVCAAILIIVFVIASKNNNGFTPNRPEGIVHISIDDVIDVFIDLTDNQNCYASIFDNEMMHNLQRMHKQYGAKFSLYCFYEKEGFNLSMVPSKYHDEFVANSDWLRFGYHAWDGKTDLATISDDLIEEDYILTNTELERITGCITHTLRLSGFQGNKEALIRLKKQGVKTLLTADDNRDSYYLDESESSYIADHDMYEDEYFTFVSTDLRLDSLFRVAVYPTLVHIALNEQQNTILAVFTHEWLMDDSM